MTGAHFKRTRPLFAALAATAFGLCAFYAQAETSAPSSSAPSADDTLIEGAKLCTRYLPRHERAYGIPEHLLAAIASTESGRFHRALGINLPWPWTINVEGAGHFYETKEQAIAAVREFQSRGIASIDVGCMQVNLMHHPNAFASLDQAFDPAYNVAYAAQFLKQNFEEEGSWRKATADYHSHTPAFGEQYANLVYGAWTRIINKVADARAGRPILNTRASNTAAKGRYINTAALHPHYYHSLRMHDITVGRGNDEETTRENGVLVVRPDYSSEGSHPVATSDDDNFVSHPVKRAKTAQEPIERSAIAPDGVSVASTGDEVSHGAQIVKVSANGTVTNRGQFEPSSHVVHASTPDAMSTASPASPDAGAPNSPFVFNN